MAADVHQEEVDDDANTMRAHHNEALEVALSKGTSAQWQSQRGGRHDDG